MSAPKVFISYSHDSPEHKEWIRNLAMRLRTNGVDATIDEWEIGPGDDLPHFMETQLSSSEYVVVVCTDNYVEKANSGTGGVGYEKKIVTAALLSNINSNKVVPIIKQNGTCNLPTFLQSKVYVDFSSEDSFEASCDKLIRTFHKSPLFQKPELGEYQLPLMKRFIEFGTVNSFMLLREAALSLYEDLRVYDKQHLHVRLAENFNDLDDGVLNYFAIVIQQNTEVWGKKPPSTKLEELDQEEWGRGHFKNGGSAFHYYGKQQPEYVDMAVKSADIPPILETVKSQSEIEYGPSPEEGL